MSSSAHIRDLITRLSRLNAAETWGDDLNPAQVSALGYLSRANRFSRSPSHVAEYLGTTRGTMSQTLKALERKGYVSEGRSEADKRSISFDLTEKGDLAAARSGALEAAISTLPPAERTRLEEALSNTLLAIIAGNEGKGFGVCKSCRYHRREEKGAYCGLLDLDLKPEETELICHEHMPSECSR